MTDIGLLAPVPSDLLEDAIKEGKTTVAFGSMAWDFFRRLSDEVGDEPLPAFLYASWKEESALSVEWAATYIMWRDAIEAESDPAFAEQRSSLAGHDWEGNDEGGRWAVYWIVEGLSRLDKPIPLSEFRLPDGRRLSAAFVPRGPTRVVAP